MKWELLLCLEFDITFAAYETSTEYPFPAPVKSHDKFSYSTMKFIRVWTNLIGFVEKLKFHRGDKFIYVKLCLRHVRAINSLFVKGLVGLVHGWIDWQTRATRENWLGWLKEIEKEKLKNVVLLLYIVRSTSQSKLSPCNIFTRTWIDSRWRWVGSDHFDTVTHVHNIHKHMIASLDLGSQGWVFILYQK